MLVVVFALTVARSLQAAGQTFSLTVEAPAALAAMAARIESMDQARMVRALTQAGLRSPDAVRMLLVDDDDPVAQNVPRWVVGQAFGTDTILIYPRRIGSYPYDSLESVVLHEVAHLALSVTASGRSLPRWFHEGVAVSIESGWGLGTQVRLFAAAWRDPGIEDVSALFAADEAPATTTAYLLSAALIEDVRRRHGAAVPGAIARRVANGQVFEDAFLSTTGETPDTAAALAWRMYRGWRWLPLVTSPSGIWGGILLLAAIAFFARLHRRRALRKRWEAEENIE